jgi:hypothetical protein
MAASKKGLTVEYLEVKTEATGFQPNKQEIMQYAS